MGDFEFLKEEYIVGDKQLDVLKKYGIQAAITDFSILLGGMYSCDNFVGDAGCLKYRTSSYYTGTFDKDNGISTIGFNGRLFKTRGIRVDYGARPMFMPIQTAVNQPKSYPLIWNVREEDGVEKFNCGEFPQSIVSEKTADILNEEYKLFCSGVCNMSKTGKEYHFSKNCFPNLNFSNDHLSEFSYNGRKYVRVRTTRRNSSSFTLSNGTEIKEPTVCWIEVEPIVWLFDETNVAITEKIIFAGIPFNKLFGKTSVILDKLDYNLIGVYLNGSFSKLIFPGGGPRACVNDDYDSPLNKEKEIIAEKKEESVFEREASYSFDYSNLDDEDLIKGAIDSDIAVFLHGKSSDGKSARVKQIDPDCEIVYLRNATPDSLNGKSVYNAEKGEMIDVPPSWYKKIKEKCEREPGKIHIVFFDELTNALPSIQGMAFNIILNKEVNGVWKLPSNCRIVAAGNDMDDSLAANEMAEPLFNRFAHVYIETTVEKWLKWASKPENNIHPAIYAYVAYKSYSKGDVLRTQYDGRSPNADPRKWEMASKVLYATRNPSMLRGVIGQSLTEDFIAFCKHGIITLEDVINGNYNDEDIRAMNLSEKFATFIGLSKCDEKDLEVVRGFVSKLGAEVLAAFDVLHSYKSEKQSLNENKTNNKR